MSTFLDVDPFGGWHVELDVVRPDGHHDWIEIADTTPSVSAAPARGCPHPPPCAGAVPPVGVAAPQPAHPTGPLLSGMVSTSDPLDADKAVEHDRASDPPVVLPPELRWLSWGM